MKRLREYLDGEDCRGVVRSAAGEIRMFHRRGVADLFELSASNPSFLRDAEVADRVVGRGAAFLFVRGNVARIYARIISSGALGVLRRGGVEVDFDAEVSNIVNRTGTGICPVEQLTSATDSPDEAFALIEKFIKNQKQQQ